MTPSSNTQSSSNTYKESLAIVLATSTTSPPLSKSDFNHLHYNIQTMHYEIQTMNDNISSMIQKLTDTSSKSDKHEEKLT